MAAKAPKYNSKMNFESMSEKEFEKVRRSCGVNLIEYCYEYCSGDINSWPKLLENIEKYRNKYPNVEPETIYIDFDNGSLNGEIHKTKETIIAEVRAVLEYREKCEAKRIATQKKLEATRKAKEYKEYLRLKEKFENAK